MPSTVPKLRPVSNETRIVIGGVDTHSQVHYAAVLEDTGRLIATEQFPATQIGCQQLVGWMMQHGVITAVGVECTGSYGARLVRVLATEQITVFEVNQPNNHLRARLGKNDRLDAIAAARAVPSGEATARPKNTTGPIEAIRYLHTTRNLLVKTRTGLLNQIKDILVTAPNTVLRSLSGATLKAKAIQAARLRPDLTAAFEPAQAAKLALLTLGKQIAGINDQIHLLDRQLDMLVAAIAPTLTSCFAVPVPARSTAAHHRWTKHQPYPLQSRIRQALRGRPNPCFLR